MTELTDLEKLQAENESLRDALNVKDYGKNPTDISVTSIVETLEKFYSNTVTPEFIISQFAQMNDKLRLLEHDMEIQAQRLQSIMRPVQ
jgi:hypothetical protein